MPKEFKKVFKVVRHEGGRMVSAANRAPIEYAVGVEAKPVIPGSLLFAFKDESAAWDFARNMAGSVVFDNWGKIQVWEAQARGVEEWGHALAHDEEADDYAEMVMFWQEREVVVKYGYTSRHTPNYVFRAPAGTLGCQGITLVKPLGAIIGGDNGEG